MPRSSVIKFTSPFIKFYEEAGARRRPKDTRPGNRLVRTRRRTPSAAAVSRPNRLLRPAARTPARSPGDLPNLFQFPINVL